MKNKKVFIRNQALILAAYAVLCLAEYVLFPMILSYKLAIFIHWHLLFNILTLIVLVRYGASYLIAPTLLYHVMISLISLSSKELGWWWAVRREHPGLVRDNKTAEIYGGILIWLVASYIIIFVMFLFIKRSYHTETLEPSERNNIKNTEKGTMWGKISVNLVLHFAGFLFIGMMGFAAAGNDSYKQGVVPIALACNIPTIIGLFIKPLKDKTNITILLACIIGFNTASIIRPMSW